jgi:hypothetical protein
MVLFRRVDGIKSDTSVVRRVVAAEGGVSNAFVPRVGLSGEQATKQEYDVDGMKVSLNTVGLNNQTPATILPKLLIQYGKPRSCSTLQDEIVCASTFLAMRSGAKAACEFEQWDVPADHVVVKTHEPEYVIQHGDGAWIFLSSKAAVPSSGMLQLLEERIGTQRTHSSIKDSIQQHYMPIFGLSSANATNLGAYITAWSDLRVCCGNQMSDSWAKWLSSNEKSKRSPSVELCSSLNLDALQHSFVRSPMQQVYHHGGRTFDRYVNCSATNQYIRQHGYKFNMPLPEMLYESFPYGAHHAASMLQEGDSDFHHLGDPAVHARQERWRSEITDDED